MMDIFAAILCYVLLATLSVAGESVLSAVPVDHDPQGPTSTRKSETAAGCDGDAAKTYDLCGVCGGDGRSCSGQGRNQGHIPKPDWSQHGSRFLWTQVWTACSVSCGVGQRRRISVCFDTFINRTVKDRKCRRRTRPYTAADECVRSPCTDDLQGDDPTPLLPKGDDPFQTHFADLFNDQIPALPKFHTGAWSACSVTCGRGTRSRDVICKLHNAYSGQENTLPDSECFGSKPPTADTCENGPCGGDLPYVASVNEVDDDHRSEFQWSTAEFTDCSQSCGGGIQESKIQCVYSSSTDIEVSPTLCSGQKKPSVITRPCNSELCPPRWVVGDYGTCSLQCGGGQRTRSVQCLQQLEDGGEDEVDDFRCPDPVPVDSEVCNNVYCPSYWVTDKWGECSKTCGIGTQTRRVYCQKEPMAGHRVTVADRKCMRPRPSPARQCSVQDCPENVAAPPVIKAENYTFIQLKRGKRIRLNVGGKVVLLPGQTITVMCPVKNFHKRLIFWSKRFKLIPMVGRVMAGLNGNLKIRKAKPGTDAGHYTCMAGTESADVRIEFLSRKEAQQKIKDIRSYLSRNAASSPRPVALETGGPRKQDGIFRDSGYNMTKKLVYLVDEWSPCSVTCGSGQQKRRVTCSRVAPKYLKIFPERECDKLGLERPESVRKCSSQGVCPRWQTSKWSKCSLVNCVRDNYAQRRRKLLCVFSNGTSSSNHLCDQHHVPETARDCVNTDCISHWTTTRWTTCRPICGTEGHKMRMLTCSWRRTGLPAWAACRSQPRPIAKKICKPRPCPSKKTRGCEDRSRYCSLARMLRMCRYRKFQRKCCKTCTEFLQSTLSS